MSVWGTVTSPVPERPEERTRQYVLDEWRNQWANGAYGIPDARRPDEGGSQQGSPLPLRTDRVFVLHVSPRTVLKSTSPKAGETVTRQPLYSDVRQHRHLLHCIRTVCSMLIG